jgi:tetratricopeptide (TPR) repeat protein
MKIWCVSLLVLGLGGNLPAQTYTLGGTPAAQPKAKPGKAAPAPAAGQSLGFGSNIENARLARAAELALKQHEYGQALDFAQRAAKAAPNDPNLWLLLGYAARLDGRGQQSVDAYSHALKLNPGSLDGLSGLAQSYRMMGRNDEAIALLKKVVAADPKRVDDEISLGELYIKSGDFDSALPWLRRAEQTQPATRSELLLAIAYQRLKQLDQANRYLDLARGRAPNNPEVQRALAGFYLETGNYADAITSLKAIRDPKPDVKAELGYAYQLNGNPSESARLYTEAADAAPKDLGLQLSAAQAQVAIGSIDSANAFLKRAAAIDPEYYRLHAIRGEIARIQDRDSDAVQEYLAVLKNLPAGPAEGPLYAVQVHLDLLDLYQNLKQENAAQEQLAIAQKQIAALDEQGAGRASFLRLRAIIAMRGNHLDSAQKDVKELLAINGKDPNNLQLDGDLLMRLNQPVEAIQAYGQILSADPKNRFALTSIGYASRAAGQDKEAEKYFQRLADAYPKLYVPFLALGDLYTARRDFTKAQASYDKAYALAPKNPQIVAGGLNAAIEAHTLDVAGIWSGRITTAMNEEPQVLREQERYLSFRGQYQQSADVGEKVITLLPRDRDVVVYLGYDLLNLGRYDELQKLATKYSEVFPKEPDIPLLAGYVAKHNGDLDAAREEFTKALDRDPNVVTAYVNRGYVFHDLHQPKDAEADFTSALKLEPNNGEAHLGLAYASLDLRKPVIALQQAQLAQQVMGDSLPIHLIRATAHGQRGQLKKSTDEYRAALKFAPNDGGLHLALADTLYTQREYHESLLELQTAQSLSPNSAAISALFARTYAQLNDREQTMHYVQLAEQQAEAQPATTAAANPSNPGSTAANALISGQRASLSGIYLSTGLALSQIGDEAGALDRFGKALTTPGSDRMSIRLAIAQIMARQDKSDDAKRQIALGLMEADTGETQPLTGEQWIGAADVFRSIHEYDLSQSYVLHARTAGASETVVRIGLANNYLALGDTARAEGELAAISSSPEADNEANYQYLLAQANVLRQEHQGPQALTAFAQASDAAGEDQTAQEALLQAGANEGYRVNSRLSLLSDVSISPVFEDTTVYVLDSKLDGLIPVQPTAASGLPLPRSSLASQGTLAYHLHLEHLPTASGFFQVRNAQGTISALSVGNPVPRNTNDYTFNFGLNPTLHLGTNVLTLNSGAQVTIRRDLDSPLALNQNLFRVFTYASTSSFFNVISASGFVLRESGPFVESKLHSATLAGGIDFRVGAPWGKTALVTGWGASKQTFSPIDNQNYYTSSYIGLQRRFFDKLDVKAVAEDLRAWRIFYLNNRPPGVPSAAIAQAVRPAGTVVYAPARNWTLQGSAAYSSTRGFHIYDAVQSGFSASYAVPVHRGFASEKGEVFLQYPIRFSAGVQQESFFNFPGPHSQQFRPFFNISIF